MNVAPVRPLMRCRGYHDQCRRQESSAVAVDVISKLCQHGMFLGSVLVHSQLGPHPPWATAEYAMQAMAIAFVMFLG